MSDAPDPNPFLPLPTAVFHILVALADRHRHGYSIMQDVAARTDGKVRLSARGGQGGQSPGFIVKSWLR